MNRRLFAGIGFGVWLVATVAFRLAGQVFFLDEQPLVLAALWLLGIVAMLALARFLFGWQRLARAQRFEAAVLLVLPGMTLDALVTEGFAGLFPNMPASAASSFGAWLLACYASVLFAALLPSAAGTFE